MTKNMKHIFEKFDSLAEVNRPWFLADTAERKLRGSTIGTKKTVQLQLARRANIGRYAFI